MHPQKNDKEKEKTPKHHPSNSLTPIHSVEFPFIPGMRSLLVAAYDREPNQRSRMSRLSIQRTCLFVQILHILSRCCKRMHLIDRHPAGHRPMLPMLDIRQLRHIINLLRLLAANPPLHNMRLEPHPKVRSAHTRVDNRKHD